MPRGVYDRSKLKTPAFIEDLARPPVSPGTTSVLAAAINEEPVSKATASETVELAFWDSVKTARDPADLEEYLDRWPEGHFVDLANRRIKQCLAAEAQGGEPEQYSPVPNKRPTVTIPPAPIPHIMEGEQIPRYMLLAPFFAENNTLYAADMEIEYLGPPNEHMYPLNDAAKSAKHDQELYLDECWGIKCDVEGRPRAPRPRELADQIQAEREGLRASGIVTGPELPPTRPDLRQGGPVADPRASRMRSVSAGQKFSDRPNLQAAPLLGRDGGRYQTMKQHGQPIPAATEQMVP